VSPRLAGIRTGGYASVHVVPIGTVCSTRLGSKMHKTRHPVRRLAAWALLGIPFIAAAQGAAADPPIATIVAAERAEILKLAARPLDAPRLADESLRTLPMPLRRYFRFTLGEQPPAHIPALVRLTLEGTVRIPQEASAAGGVTRATPWLTHSGTEWLSLSAGNAAFHWHSLWLRPDGRHVEVRDKYDAGRSHILARLDGKEPLIDEEGDSADKADFLIRLFAEATQMPPYLLPSRYLRWEAVDEQHARAVLSDGAVRAEMVCRFAESGALERCDAQQRRLRVSGPQGGYAVPAQWSVTRSDYRTLAGMRVPTSAVVSWTLGAKTWDQVTLKLTALDTQGQQP
jgi:hypothetical protein